MYKDNKLKKPRKAKKYTPPTADEFWENVNKEKARIAKESEKAANREYTWYVTDSNRYSNLKGTNATRQQRRLRAEIKRWGM